MRSVLLPAWARLYSAWVQKGYRYALPHATIHMHPTGGGTQGFTEDVPVNKNDCKPSYFIWWAGTPQIPTNRQ